MRKLIYIIILSITLFSCNKAALIKPTVPLTIVPGTKQVTMIKDTIVNNIWDGGGNVLRVENTHIYGTGTLQNWIIDAGSQYIFDTSIKIVNCKSYSGSFNAKWYGANPALADNWAILQQCIKTTITNKIPALYIPAGWYKTYGKLNVFVNVNEQTTIHIYGDSHYATDGTVINYMLNVGTPLNLQLQKGSEVNNISFVGTWKSPVYKDSSYYQMAESQYNDVSGNNNSAIGMTIDGNFYGSYSGSTKINVHDCYIGGFATLINISQNGQTQNADNLTFSNINCGDSRVIFQNGQAQEKNNILQGFQCWANNYTAFSNGNAAEYQAGDYTLKNWNCAGRIVRLFNINCAAWFMTKVENMYAENFGRIGNISSQITNSFTGCTFEPAFKSEAGNQILLTSNTALTVFTNCLICYYNGYSNELWMRGAATFVNCSFYKDKIVWK